MARGYPVAYRQPGSGVSQPAMNFAPGFQRGNSYIRGIRPSMLLILLDDMLNLDKGRDIRFDPRKAVDVRALKPHPRPFLNRLPRGLSRGAELASAFAATAAALYALYELWRSLEQSGDVGIGPEGSESFCYGYGTHQGVQVQASCGDNLEKAFPPEFFGWMHLGANWHWQNNADAGFAFEQAGTPFHNMTKVGHWIRSDALGEPTAGPQRSPSWPLAETPYVPTLDPLSIPPFAPEPRWLTPRWRDMPKRHRNPERSPTEQRRAGNVPPKDRMDLPRYDERLDPPMEASPHRPRWRKVDPPRSQKHRDERPPERTKERKVQLSGAARVALRVGYAMTEYVDFVEALYDALPYRFREQARREAREAGEKVGPHRKMQMVFLHFDDLDVSQAVFNILENAVEDLIVGGASGFTSRRLTRKGIVHGPFGISPLV